MKVIAEIGINFNGSLDIAKKMIKESSDAGCDFAKFQLFRADSFYPKSAGELDWFDGKKKYSYDIYEAVKNFELAYVWLDELVDYCNKKNIQFLASVFNFNDLEIYKKLNLDYIKLASYSITNLPLIEEVAKTGMHIFLSTGGSFLSEVDEAVRSIRKYHNNFTLMHCSIAYPTPLDKVNMGIIETFKKAFECEVGYSDHTAEIYEAPLQAKLLGVSVIEKHITFDKNAEGPDHFFALDEKELKIMVEKLKNETPKLNKKIYGSSQRICYPHEKYLRNFAYHQLFVNRDIKKGESITQKDISILRRGKKKKGLEPKYFALFKNDVVAKKNLEKETPINWNLIL
jgi:N,N'-diacetyllegionaminate synthase